MSMIFDERALYQVLNLTYPFLAITLIPITYLKTHYQ